MSERKMNCEDCGFTLCRCELPEPPECECPAVAGCYNFLGSDMNEETQDKLIFVGYTNGYQILYASEASEGEGAFYSDTDNDCYIPLYMLKNHAHRLENTTGGNVTLERIKAERKRDAG